MTYTTLPNETAPLVLRPLFRKPNLHYWQDELRYLDLEIKFYQQLLAMGIENATIWCQPLLRELLQEFSKIQKEDLETIKREFSLLKENIKLEQSAAFAFSRKIDQITAILRQLKTRFFPYIHELQALTIW